MINNIDKELSLMKFNERVLQQLTLEKNPNGEKCKFLQIANNNLDEFISVKYSKFMHGYPNIDEDNLIDAQLIDKLGSTINKYYGQIQKYFKSRILYSLKNVDSTSTITLEADVKKLSLEEIDEGKKDALLSFSDICDNIVECGKPLSRNLYMYLSYTDGDYKIYDCSNVDRFVDVMSICKSLNNVKYVPIELMIKESSDNIKDVFMFRVIRDSYIDLERLDNNNLLESMKKAVEDRITAPIVAIECPNSRAYDLIINYLNEICDDISVICIPLLSLAYNGICGISNAISQITEENYLNYFQDRPSNKIKVGKKLSVMDVVKKRDILLMHPFDDYGTVIRLLQEASENPNVTHIYQTLYRVSSVDSPIVNALCNAADNGKKVTVCVEVKARFNESMNFDIIEKLQSHENVNLILSNNIIKVHCKAMLILGKGIRYCHIATGNYNEKTSEIYTDISLLTTDKVMCKDLKKLFKMLADKEYKGEFKKIVAQPGVIRETLIKKIDACIQEVKNGNNPIVTIKVNGISDKIIMDYIKYAADLGVKFNIICRGICLLTPTENISICSIVGRYLEHSRIYKFDYDSKKLNNQVYISSADLLTRNLERRVEILCKVTDVQCKRKINKILKAYNKDTQNKFEYNPETLRYESFKGEKNVYDVFDKPIFNESIK